MNDADPPTSHPPSNRTVARRDALHALSAGSPEALAAALLDALEALAVAVSIKDIASERYRYVNAPMAALLGGDAPSLVGSTDAQRLAPARAAALRAAEQVALAQGAASHHDHRLEHGGEVRDYEVVRLPLDGGAGGPASQLLAVWIDRSASRQTQQRLQAALAQLEQQQAAARAPAPLPSATSPVDATRDAATGLFQRAHFEDQLRREVDLSMREHREFALVSIAIDAPLPSASEGRPATIDDLVLEAVARLLRGNTRTMDAACRVGGSRFAVLLSGIGLATAHARMEGLRRQCATQIVVEGGRDFRFTASMGVASFPHTAETEAALLEAAEAARTEAERRGGNQVSLASIRFDTGG